MRGPRPEPLVPVECSFVPEPNGVASLAKQIRLSCRAYPLFEVAALVVQKPDRYEVVLRVMRDKEGKARQPLFGCSLDDTVWLSEADAVRHVLSQHFDTFYSTEKLATDAPKGTYTFVAQCGISGEVLGPPNYHGYQERLRRIHAERFNRMPFDVYKSRVRIVKDEAVVKQWLESQSFRAEYTALNVPEPVKFASREEVEVHFRETHAANLIREVDSAPVKRELMGRLPAPLQAVVRVSLDRERRFPIRTGTALSQAFANIGLQFFKRDRNIVHVAVARPHHLDMETQVVSDGVRKIVGYIAANPSTSRKQLIDALAPSSGAGVVPVPAPVPQGVPAGEASAAGAPAASPEAAPAAAESPVPTPPAMTPERDALLNDLHWLLHQGHVIEFSTGQMELAQKPAARPEPSAGPAPAEGQRRQGGRAEKPPRQLRPDRTPWSRKHGLMAVTTPGYPAYIALPQLAGV